MSRQAQGWAVSLWKRGWEIFVSLFAASSEVSFLGYLLIIHIYVHLNVGLRKGGQEGPKFSRPRRPGLWQNKLYRTKHIYDKLKGGRQSGIFLWMQCQLSVALLKCALCVRVCGGGEVLCPSLSWRGRFGCICNLRAKCSLFPVCRKPTVEQCCRERI